MKREVPVFDLKPYIKVTELTVLAVLYATCLTCNLKYDLKAWKEQELSRHKMAKIKMDV